MDKILLVDDDKVTLRFLEHFLIDNNFFILTAQDGQSALELALKDKPTLVVSDLVLPKIDGAELCKRIKHNPELKKTKVILMSATYMGSVLRSVAGDCGADEFISKPIRSSDLLEKITRLSFESTATGKKKDPS